MFEQQYIYNHDLVYKAEKKTFEKIDSFRIMQRAAKACYTYISENLIHSSGILSIVAHGLYISYTGRTGYSPNIKETLEHLWSFISSIINNIIFVLAGVIIFLNVSYSNILAIDFLYLVILYNLHLINSLLFLLQL